MTWRSSRWLAHNTAFAGAAIAVGIGGLIATIGLTAKRGTPAEVIVGALLVTLAIVWFVVAVVFYQAPKPPKRLTVTVPPQSIEFTADAGGVHIETKTMPSGDVSITVQLEPPNGP